MNAIMPINVGKMDKACQLCCRVVVSLYISKGHKSPEWNSTKATCFSPQDMQTLYKADTSRHRSSWLKPAQNRTNRWSWKWQLFVENQPLPESIANQYEVVDSSLSWLETHPWHLGDLGDGTTTGNVLLGEKPRALIQRSLHPNGWLSRLKSVHVGWVPFMVVGLKGKGILRDWLLDKSFDPRKFEDRRKGLPQPPLATNHNESPFIHSMISFHVHWQVDLQVQEPHKPREACWKPK